MLKPHYGEKKEEWQHKEGYLVIIEKRLVMIRLEKGGAVFSFFSKGKGGMDQEE